MDHRSHDAGRRPGDRRIIVTNLLGEDVVVERCLFADGAGPPARPSAPSRRMPTSAPSRPRRPPRRPTTRPLHPPRKRRQSGVPAGPRSGRRHLRFPTNCQMGRILVHGIARPRLQPDGLHRVRDVHLQRVQQRAAVNAGGCSISPSSPSNSSRLNRSAAVSSRPPCRSNCARGPSSDCRTRSLPCCPPCAIVNILRSSKTCLNRCEGCERGGLIPIADGMPMSAPTFEAFLNDLEVLAAEDA